MIVVEILLPVLLVVVLFLVSCFWFWLPYHDETILYQLFNLFSLEFSCFWLWITWRWRRGRFSSSLFPPFILLSIFEFRFETSLLLRSLIVILFLSVSFSSPWSSSSVSSVVSSLLTFSFLLLFSFSFLLSLFILSLDCRGLRCWCWDLYRCAFNFWCLIAQQRLSCSYLNNTNRLLDFWLRTNLWSNWLG